MKTSIGLPIALAFAAFSAPAVAKSGQILSSMNGKSYTLVRSKLISLGYRSFRTRNRSVDDGLCPGLSSCAAYPELVYCSGTGIAICESAFLRRRTRQYIKVFSYGETAKRIDGIYRATDLDLREWGVAP
jgi:hypothetical protein